MLTIADNQRDTYDSRVCLYCPSGVTGSEIHLILECPATSHVALDLIKLLTTLLYDTCQPDRGTLTTHQQTSLILGDTPSTLPKKFHHKWFQSTLPAILDYVSHLETKTTTPRGQSPSTILLTYSKCPKQSFPRKNAELKEKFGTKLFR